MSKTPSSKLYQLIHALNSAEKRYFKIFTRGLGGQSGGKYLLLFEAFDNQKTFDDAAAKEAVYPDEPLESRKYSELKAYLYELILRCLQSYDEESSAMSRLRNQLQQVRAMFKRGRYSDCKDLLEKVKKSALYYEDFTSLIEALRWIKQVAYAEMNVRFLNEQLADIDEEERKYLAALENLSAYRALFFRLYISIRTQAVLRNEDQMSHMRAIKEAPLLADVSQTASHIARIIFYRIHNLLYYSVADIPNFYDSGKLLLEAMDAKPHLLKEDVSEYISALSNYTMSCGLLEKYEEVGTCLNKFKQIKTNTIDDKLKIHLLYYSYKFSLCVYTGDFSEGLRALQEHFDEAQQFEGNVLERSSLYFYYFYIYFGNGDYDTSLEYLNQWLSMPRGIERQDLQGMARMINLIVHYEMGNYMLLESLIRSTYRYLQRRERLLGYERSILQFLHDAQKIASPRELPQTFHKLKDSLELLRQSPSESAMLRYFDIIAWLESKLSGEAFAKVVQKHYRERSQ